MATADAVIAATVLAHGAQLATRDLADFADLGLDLINPWAC
jgi:predicted nucleic acid-binding protein